MRLRLLRVDDMRHFHPTGFQKIRDQPAMTMPPDRFRAHDRGRSGRFRQVQQVFDPRRKFRRSHVIGITTESSIVPSGINGVLFRPAPSSSGKSL